MLTALTDKVTLGDSSRYCGKSHQIVWDMCFADPPFNLDKRYNAYKDERPDNEYLGWCRQWLSELVR
jgi:DNA modification methylase